VRMAEARSGMANARLPGDGWLTPEQDYIVQCSIRCKDWFSVRFA
jgi:hypothetical protein